MSTWETSQLFSLVIVFGCLVMTTTKADENVNAANEFFKSTAELVQLRGYKAIDHFVQTTDGFMINVVEIQNPLLDKGYDDSKEVLVFFHGTFTNANFFIYNSVNAKPKNYANFNAGNMSLFELDEMLAQDPASNSLPFLASNFGHSTWLVNRRGSHFLLDQAGADKKLNKKPPVNISKPNEPSSRRAKRQANQEKNEPIKFLVDLSRKMLKLNMNRLENLVSPRHWNWSLDEQANIDLPQVFDYILEKTNKKKLSVVGHSAGGALILMALAERPELSNKISKGFLWAPALYLSSSIRTKLLALFFMFPLHEYIGPVPPKILSPLIQGMLGALCSNNITQRTICHSVIWAFFGPHGSRPTAPYPAYYSTLFDSFGSHDLDSLTQSAERKKMPHFGYFNPLRNLKKYNSIMSPIYDVSKINATCLSFYSGVTDKLVPDKSILKILKDMKVPAKHYLIKGPDAAFNHISFVTHNDVARLLNIPLLKTLES